MKRRVFRSFVSCAVVLAGTCAQAEEAPSYVPLETAMQGATAMTTVAGAYLFVARSDGGYICAINLNDRFFPAVRDGAADVAFANRPGALCVSARFVDNLADAEKPKL